MKPIFIISQHRTGSTLLKNILDRNSKVVMAFDEMNLYEPFRKNTLDKLIPDTVKSPTDLIRAIDEKRIYGSFWKNFDKSEIDRKKLIRSLNKVEKFDHMAVLNQVLLHLRGSNENISPGVKYPVHFSGIAVLKNFFPDCRLIFLTRNPKAIIASKINDPSTKRRKNKSIIHSFIIHYFTLFYFCIEYNLSQKKYTEFNSRGLLVTYEDLVETKATVRKICEYLKIEFEEDMLKVTGKNSSHNNQRGTKSKIFQSSKAKYLEVLKPFDLWLIDILTQNK